MSNGTPGHQNASFMPLMEIFSQSSIVVLSLLKRSDLLKFLVELNLGLCDILESSFFYCMASIHLIVIA